MAPARLLAIGVLAATAITGAGAQAPSALQVIATGLDNPRGIGFGPDGALYVVEAGRGGVSPLCLSDPGLPPGVVKCYGPTGAVSRITGVGVQQRVVTGLPSLALGDGSQATGPHDIGFGIGRTWILMGLGGNPAVRAPFEAAGIRLGTLVRVLPNGQWDHVVDVAAHEVTNPDGTTIDSNPYGLLIQDTRAVVADAGANTLLQISLNGAISTLAVFPARTTPPFFQSVPTTVTAGPDGSLYVGELTGQPFPVGAAQVYRVPSTGGTPTVVAGGFTNIIDIAFGPNGEGYVLEHDADGIIPPLGPGVLGRLVRLNRDGTRTVIASAGLIKPGGVAVGPDGAVYVTNRSISAGVGEVVRIVP
jgi:sugar lactone lactonase YvrE